MQYSRTNSASEAVRVSTSLNAQWALRNLRAHQQVCCFVLCESLFWHRSGFHTTRRCSLCNLCKCQKAESVRDDHGSKAIIVHCIPTERPVSELRRAGLCSDRLHTVCMYGEEQTGRDWARQRHTTKLSACQRLPIGRVALTTTATLRLTERRRPALSAQPTVA